MRALLIVLAAVGAAVGVGIGIESGATYPSDYRLDGIGFEVAFPLPPQRAGTTELVAHGLSAPPIYQVELVHVVHLEPGEVPPQELGLPGQVPWVGVIGHVVQPRAAQASIPPSGERTGHFVLATVAGYVRSAFVEVQTVPRGAHSFDTLWTAVETALPLSGSTGLELSATAPNRAPAVAFLDSFAPIG